MHSGAVRGDDRTGAETNLAARYLQELEDTASEAVSEAVEEWEYC